VRAASSLRVPRSRQLYWGAVFGLLLLASLCSLAVFLFSADWLKTAGALPVALHSGLRADYSADLRGLKPLALSMGLIGEAARDQQPGATNPLPALEILLQTPVAWVTSTGTSPTAGPPTQPATATSPASGVTQPAPSATAGATQAPTATLLPTLTFTATYTLTVTPSAVQPTLAPPTRTQPPPTDTRPPSVTRPPTSTPTQPPPPTATNTPRPPTQPPPTAYPPPATVPPTPNPYP